MREAKNVLLGVEVVRMVSEEVGVGPIFRVATAALVCNLSCGGDLRRLARI